jgi:glutamate racemase
MTQLTPGPIGIFDSGYGGLTVFKEIAQALPQYNYVYLGDNARAPYGTRSFEVVYDYTFECVQHLFRLGCRLVILACNTASAKALRTIQQQQLPLMHPSLRVLGVIRPTTERLGEFTQTGCIGVLATAGTVASESYLIEAKRFFPDIRVVQEACPMWVPLVENNEHLSPGADYFVQQHVQNILDKAPNMDALVLACTHYPLLLPKIRQYLPEHIRVIAQGAIVASSLTDYLHRHPELEVLCQKGGQKTFYTTESPDTFDAKAGIFFGERVRSRISTLAH